MTSAVLEVHMMPIFGASNPQPSPSPLADDDPSASTSGSLPAEAVIEVAVPETIASPKPIAPAPTVESSETIAPVAAPPTAAPETANPETVRGAAEVEAQPTPAETGSNPETGAASKQSPGTTAESERLAAARQVVSERLAALVNRDRLSKEAQLQQNLVTLALHYAQLGEFADARQVAQHPALSLEMQATTLAEIDKLITQVPGQPRLPEQPEQLASGQPRLPEQPEQLASGQPGQPGQLASGQPGQPEGQPGQPLVAETVENSLSSANSLENTANGATPITVSIDNSVPESSYLTVPSTPDLLQPYLSDRCLNSASSPTPNDAASKPAGVQPKRSLTFLPIGQQVAARLSTNEILAAQVVKPTAKQTQPIVIMQTVKVSRVATIAPKLQPGQSPQLKPSQLKQIPQSQSLNVLAAPHIASSAVESSAVESSAVESSAVGSSAVRGDRMITIPEVQSFDGLGMVLPSLLPKTLQALLERWISGPSSLPSNFPNGNADSAQTRQLSFPQLIKLSRGATKIGSTLHVTKSVANNQIVSAIPSSTSGYWRTIAANCGGLDSAGNSSGSNRLISSSMIFPLPIPVPLTSGFGWRVHPIRGDHRFHSGIDLGAPFGTPVLSALAGLVISAEDMGGYGLAVIVEASSAQQQNLYAHLSAIAVKPGDVVEQGSVLGLVGSTGSSTGPHLHFETLLPSTEGWTAVDPLGAAMAAATSQVAQK